MSGFSSSGQSQLTPSLLLHNQSYVTSDARAGDTLRLLPRRKELKARVLYRISSILLLLFAAGHTIGFRKTQPIWGADSVIASMQSIRFDAQGFTRSYWDFYVGFGLFATVFFVFSAALTWQFGGLPEETLARLRGPAWALAICFLAVGYLSWRYFFIVPIVFSIILTICLSAAAWLSAKPVR